MAIVSAPVATEMVPGVATSSGDGGSKNTKIEFLYRDASNCATCSSTGL